MTDRLSAVDASLFYLDDGTAPQHVAGLSVFARPRSGFDYEALVRLVEHRIALVPRYRQKVREVPARLARPVWVDDADFDITYHVRRSALPKPGSDAQLHDLVARLVSRQLDRTRPLWEMYLVEGLARGRFAIITKTHEAMVDGVSALEIGQVILDVTAKPRHTREELWMPAPGPGSMQLLTDAALEAVTSPGEAVDAVRWATRDATRTAEKAVDLVGGALGMVGLALRTATRPAPTSPLNARISRQRRFAVARTRLDDYRAVRERHGGTVNDVVLAVVAGAMRGWLLSRGESVTAATTVRAMAPMSVTSEAGASSRAPGTAPVGTPGSLVSQFLVDLPAGEPNPVVRLSQVAHATRVHEESGRSVGADALVRMTGFAPPTLHAMGARVAGTLSRRAYNVLVTNVPGPQVPLYATGAKMLEMYPVVPLARNQALTIGLTSYDGGVYFGLNADRDAMGDVDVLAALIVESLEELVGTVRA
ncbi:MAG: wax ester/triacylglycerol synthase family O-acyltransferase [Mycobacteriaceae bacterium]